MDKQLYDLIIVGAGPAAMSAAVYAGRGQLKTAFFGDETKGNLYKSHIISNYLGFPEDPTGPELVELGLKHAKRFGAEHIRQEIVDVSLNQDETFSLKDNLQNTYQAKTVLLATGQSYVLSGIKGEQEYTGKGVSYCVTCDGFFFKNKQVVVIGSGDYAAEEALQLLAYTPNITILSHGKEFAFNQAFQEELGKNNIKTIVTPRLASLSGEEKVTKLTFTKPLTDGSTEMATDGIFMAIGIAGANAFAKKLGLEMDGNYIKVDKDGLTNVKGLFAAGDCTGSPPQVASSVGNGCNAALSAIKLVRGLRAYIQYN
ncbi:FAD-dependent oxidoreductase [Candidatus Peregrinibacteria bacterium]|nr:FAD-dependent oxidoreductase [Candidatus Peregrinibacteria bacterium]